MADSPRKPGIGLPNYPVSTVAEDPRLVAERLKNLVNSMGGVSQLPGVKDIRHIGQGLVGGVESFARGMGDELQERVDRYKYGQEHGWSLPRQVLSQYVPPLPGVERALKVTGVLPTTPYRPRIEEEQKNVFDKTADVIGKGSQWLGSFDPKLKEGEKPSMRQRVEEMTGMLLPSAIATYFGGPRMGMAVGAPYFYVSMRESSKRDLENAQALQLIKKGIKPDSPEFMQEMNSPYKRNMAEIYGELHGTIGGLLALIPGLQGKGAVAEAGPSALKQMITSGSGEKALQIAAGALRQNLPGALGAGSMGAVLKGGSNVFKKAFVDPEQHLLEGTGDDALLFFIHTLTSSAGIPKNKLNITPENINLWRTSLLSERLRYEADRLQASQNPADRIEGKKLEAIANQKDNNGNYQVDGAVNKFMQSTRRVVASWQDASGRIRRANPNIESTSQIVNQFARNVNEEIGGAVYSGLPIPYESMVKLAKRAGVKTVEEIKTWIEENHPNFQLQDPTKFAKDVKKMTRARANEEIPLTSTSPIPTIRITKKPPEKFEVVNTPMYQESDLMGNKRAQSLESWQEQNQDYLAKQLEAYFEKQKIPKHLIPETTTRLLEGWYDQAYENFIETTSSRSGLNESIVRQYFPKTGRVFKEEETLPATPPEGLEEFQRLKGKFTRVGGNGGTKKGVPFEGISGSLYGADLKDIENGTTSFKYVAEKDGVEIKKILNRDQAVAFANSYLENSELGQTPRIKKAFEDAGVDDAVRMDRLFKFPSKESTKTEPLPKPEVPIEKPVIVSGRFRPRRDEFGNLLGKYVVGKDGKRRYVGPTEEVPMYEGFYQPSREGQNLTSRSALDPFVAYVDEIKKILNTPERNRTPEEKETLKDSQLKKGDYEDYIELKDKQYKYNQQNGRAYFEAAKRHKDILDKPVDQRTPEEIAELKLWGIEADRRLTPKEQSRLDDLQKRVRLNAILEQEKLDAENRADLAAQRKQPTKTNIREKRPTEAVFDKRGRQIGTKILSEESLGISRKTPKKVGAGRSEEIPTSEQFRLRQENKEALLQRQKELRLGDSKPEDWQWIDGKLTKVNGEWIEYPFESAKEETVAPLSWKRTKEKPVEEVKPEITPVIKTEEAPKTSEEIKKEPAKEPVKEPAKEPAKPPTPAKETKPTGKVGKGKGKKSEETPTGEKEKPGVSPEEQARQEQARIESEKEQDRLRFEQEEQKEQADRMKFDQLSEKVETYGSEPTAQEALELAEMYGRGIGTEKDIDQARKMFELANDIDPKVGGKPLADFMTSYDQYINRLANEDGMPGMSRTTGEKKTSEETPTTTPTVTTTPTDTSVTPSTSGKGKGKGKGKVKTEEASEPPVTPDATPEQIKEQTSVNEEVNDVKNQIAQSIVDENKPQKKTTPAQKSAQKKKLRKSIKDAEKKVEKQNEINQNQADKDLDEAFNNDSNAQDAVRLSQEGTAPKDPTSAEGVPPTEGSKPTEPTQEPPQPPTPPTPPGGGDKPSTPGGQPTPADPVPLHERPVPSVAKKWIRIAYGLMDSVRNIRKTLTDVTLALQNHNIPQGKDIANLIKASHNAGKSFISEVMESGFFKWNNFKGVWEYVEGTKGIVQDIADMLPEAARKSKEKVASFYDFMGTWAARKRELEEMQMIEAEKAAIMRKAGEIVDIDERNLFLTKNKDVLGIEFIYKGEKPPKDFEGNPHYLHHTREELSEAGIGSYERAVEKLLDLKEGEGKELLEKSNKRFMDQNKEVIKMAYDSGIIDDRGLKVFGDAQYYIPYKILHSGENITTDHFSSVSADFTASRSKFYNEVVPLHLEKEGGAGSLATGIVLQNARLSNWSRITEASLLNKAKLLFFKNASKALMSPKRLALWLNSSREDIAALNAAKMDPKELKYHATRLGDEVKGDKLSVSWAYENGKPVRYLVPESELREATQPSSVVWQNSAKSAVTQMKNIRTRMITFWPSFMIRTKIKDIFAHSYANNVPVGQQMTFLKESIKAILNIQARGGNEADFAKLEKTIKEAAINGVTFRLADVLNETSSAINTGTGRINTVGRIVEGDSRLQGFIQNAVADAQASDVGFNLHGVNSLMRKGLRSISNFRQKWESSGKLAQYRTFMENAEFIKKGEELEAKYAEANSRFEAQKDVVDSITRELEQASKDGKTEDVLSAIKKRRREEQTKLNLINNEISDIKDESYIRFRRPIFESRAVSGNFGQIAGSKIINTYYDVMPFVRSGAIEIGRTAEAIPSGLSQLVPGGKKLWEAGSRYYEENLKAGVGTKEYQKEIDAISKDIESNNKSLVELKDEQAKSLKAKEAALAQYEMIYDAINRIPSEEGKKAAEGKVIQAKEVLDAARERYNNATRAVKGTESRIDRLNKEKSGLEGSVSQRKADIDRSIEERAYRGKMFKRVLLATVAVNILADISNSLQGDDSGSNDKWWKRQNFIKIRMGDHVVRLPGPWTVQPIARTLTDGIYHMSALVWNKIDPEFKISTFDKAQALAETFQAVFSTQDAQDGDILANWFGVGAFTKGYGVLAGKNLSEIRSESSGRPYVSEEMAKIGDVSLQSDNFTTSPTIVKLVEGSGLNISPEALEMYVKEMFPAIFDVISTFDIALSPKAPIPQNMFEKNEQGEWVAPTYEGFLGRMGAAGRFIGRKGFIGSMLESGDLSTQIPFGDLADKLSRDRQDSIALIKTTEKRLRDGLERASVDPETGVSVNEQTSGKLYDEIYNDKDLFRQVLIQRLSQNAASELGLLKKQYDANVYTVRFDRSKTDEEKVRAIGLLKLVYDAQVSRANEGYVNVRNATLQPRILDAWFADKKEKDRVIKSYINQAERDLINTVKRGR